jgi:hypothetical protein
MTAFPALVPSSRTFTPGEYPATAFSGFSGVQNRVRHSNVFLDAQLRLNFLGLTQAQMLDIWNHYNGRRGEFRSFALPAEVVSNGSITDYVPGSYLWRYAGPGSVEDLPCGGHNVSLTLATVPPIAASVVGADLFMRLRLSAGAANGGEYALGINETITLSVDGGAAFVAQNGIASTLTLSLQAGDAIGDAGVSGVNLIIYFGLSTFSAVNSGANGINEIITLALAPGAATGSNDSDFSSVSLLLHMDGSNGSTTFTDSSSNGFTVTAYGGAQLTTSDKKYGTAAGSFDGANGTYVQTPADSAFAFGTGDFTIEMWLKPATIGDNDGVFTFGTTGPSLSLFGNNWWLSDADFGGSSMGAASAGSWQHIAITRSGTSARLFSDGTLRGTLTWSKDFTHNQIDIGRYALSFGTIYVYDGLIDDLRITKGVARYTANFTPPAQAFPDS